MMLEIVQYNINPAGKDLNIQNKNIGIKYIIIFWLWD